MVMVCGKPLQAFFVRASLRETNLVVAVQEDPEHGTRTVLDYLRLVPGAQAAISGGYLASFYPPLPIGLVKTAGKVVNHPQRSTISDGLICFNRGSYGISIAPIGTSAQSFTDCLQAGPLLVTDQRAVTDFEERHYPKGFLTPTLRAFVAMLPEGFAVLGIVEAARLDGLAQFLARPAKKGGLGALAAINLSGASSAGIAAQSDETFGNANVFLPNAIVVTNVRSTAPARAK